MQIIKTIPVLLALIFLTGCSAGEKEDADGSDADKPLNGFTLTETEGATKKWILEAESARFPQDREQTVEVIKLNMRFYEEDSVTHLKAESGEYNKKTRVLMTQGKVEIETEKRKIVTEDVRWDPERKLFLTESCVDIITPEGRIRGRGLESSMDLEKIKIKEKIEGEIQESGVSSQ
jgi:LPS export ABC transporter protein LptC